MSDRYIEYCPICDDYVDTVLVDDIIICCHCNAELGFMSDIEEY